MNILFLDAYYEPELIAYTHLESDLIEGLVSAGHKISVICPTPTRGITEEVRKKYKHLKEEYKFKGSVKIERFLAPCEGQNPVGRAFRYLWCNLRTYQKAIKLGDIDIVFSNSTPPTQGVLSAFVAKKLSKRYGARVPFIYNLQDIFPDSLVNSGLTHKGSILWKIGRKIESYAYTNADKIVVISDGFKRNIIGKGVPEEKIEVVSNWIDLDLVHSVDRKDNTLISEFGIDTTKFLVVYAGNMGEAQGAEIVLNAAEKLQDKNDIQFVIFGGGANYGEAAGKAKNLKNVIIHPLLPQERVSEVYSLGDIALITCKPGTGSAGMPSKIWSIMACNTPIIASFDTDSDLANVIRKSGAGQCVEPGDADKLVDAIIKSKLERKNTDIRSFVARNASKQECVSRMIKTINHE